MTNDFAIEPVLGYDLNMNLNLKKIPPSLNSLLVSYSKEVEFIKGKKLNANKETIDKWNYLIDLDETTALKSYTPGCYLIQTKWNQKYGFNQFCPIDPTTGSKSLVGCSGVALAQILRYWECRVFPDNSISYTPLNFTNPISVNFYDFDYNWQEMSNTIGDEYNSLLLYHCAVAIQADFSSKQTSASRELVKSALRSYFGFHADNIKYKYLNEPTWINSLKTEINSGRPIFYSGSNYNPIKVYPSHAWVIDGYNSSNQFHCNWGWGGEYNSWYTLTDLSPGSLTYNDGQCAIMNIYPMLDACEGINGPVEVCTSNTTYSISKPTSASVIWTKSSNLTQFGYNTYSTYYVHSSSNLQMEMGFVKATIKNSQGRTILERTKPVWLGYPSFTIISEEILTTLMPGIALIDNDDYDPYSDQGVNRIDWSYSGPLTNFVGGIDKATFRAGSSPGQGCIYANAYNTCGAIENRFYFQVVESRLLNVDPNPASVSINISEGTPSNDNVPWVLRLMSGQGAVMVNVTTTLPKSINVSGLQTGVYILHARRGQYVEQQVIIIE